MRLVELCKYAFHNLVDLYLWLNQLFSLKILSVFQLSEVLVEMGSNLMQVDDQILSQAQKEKRACSSIVGSLETLAWPQLHPNAQYLSMVGDTPGLKC